MPPQKAAQNTAPKAAQKKRAQSVFRILAARYPEPAPMLDFADPWGLLVATALAARQRAEADGKETHLAYTRLLAVNQEHSHLVAQQDIDAAEAKDLEAEAARAGAAAEVEKYESLLSYTKITAPFDGVVTRRYADPGSLIQAGTSSSSQARPLVKVSDNFKLRLDFRR